MRPEHNRQPFDRLLSAGAAHSPAQGVCRASSTRVYGDTDSLIAAWHDAQKHACWWEDESPLIAGLWSDIARGIEAQLEARGVTL